MKKINILIVFLFGAILLHAQQNKEDILKSLKVSEIKKFQVIHAFTSRADTCLTEQTILDENGKIIYEMRDYNCSGYRKIDETYKFYKNTNVVKEVLLVNGDSIAIYLWDYSKKDKLPQISTVIDLKNADTTHTKYTYYTPRRSNRIDSMKIDVVNRGSTIVYYSQNTYDKKDNLLSTRTTNDKGDLLEESTSEWDEQGNVTSTSSSAYGDRPVFEQTFLKYDEEGLLVETNNSHNRQNKFFYMENGLLRNMESYNAQGALEIEYIYNYIFWK